MFFIKLLDAETPGSLLKYSLQPPSPPLPRSTDQNLGAGSFVPVSKKWRDAHNWGKLGQ